MAAWIRKEDLARTLLGLSAHADCEGGRQGPCRVQAREGVYFGTASQALAAASQSTAARGCTEAIQRAAQHDAKIAKKMSWAECPRHCKKTPHAHGIKEPGKHHNSPTPAVEASESLDDLGRQAAKSDGGLHATGSHFPG